MSAQTGLMRTSIFLAAAAVGACGDSGEVAEVDGADGLQPADETGEAAEALTVPPGGRIASGSYVGSGASARQISVGFKPEFVVVQNAGFGDAQVRGGAMTKTILPRTGASTVNGITALTTDGFTVGSNANWASGSTWYWTAFAPHSGIKVKSYTGNGIDNRTISTPFAPAATLVIGERESTGRIVDRPSVWRSQSHPGDTSCKVTGGCSSNRIQAFVSSGFQIGSDSSVNKKGAIFHVVAWDSSAVSTGTFTPQATLQTIPTPSPVGYLFLQGTSSQTARHRSDTAGLLTLNLTGGSSAKEVTAVSSTAFTVGPTTTSQSGASTYWFGTHHWLGVKR